eukprot:6460551-Amphidinium_carterae.3
MEKSGHRFPATPDEYRDLEQRIVREGKLNETLSVLEWKSAWRSLGESQEGRRRTLAGSRQKRAHGSSRLSKARAAASLR